MSESMVDWIGYTRCVTCGFTDKVLFQKPDDAPDGDGTAHVGCPKCGHAARYITFPAFDVQTFDLSSPGDALRDEMEDW